MASQIQRYNENENRSFPISEGATQTDDTGKPLPTSLIADINLSVPHSCAKLFLHTVTVTDKLLAVTICAVVDGHAVGAYAVAGGGYNKTDLMPYKAYPLVGLIDNVTGWIVFGSLDSIQPMSLKFSTLAQSAFDDHAIRTIPELPIPYITKLGYTNNKLSGLPKIVAGNNVAITATESIVTLKLSVGANSESFAPICGKPASVRNCRLPPILNINGVFADATGKIRIVFKKST